MKPIYAKTQDTRLAGLERRVRFLERREQIPNPHLEGDLGGGGVTVAEEGVELPVEPVLNFVGPGVTATDNPGAARTDVEISGIAFDVTPQTGGFLEVESTGSTGITIHSLAGSSGDITIHSADGDGEGAGTGDILIIPGGYLIISGIQSSDPMIPGAIWFDGSGGYLRISAAT